MKTHFSDYFVVLAYGDNLGFYVFVTMVTVAN